MFSSRFNFSCQKVGFTPKAVMGGVKVSNMRSDIFEKIGLDSSAVLSSSVKSDQGGPSYLDTLAKEEMQLDMEHVGSQIRYLNEI